MSVPDHHASPEAEITRLQQQIFYDRQQIIKQSRKIRARPSAIKKDNMDMDLFLVDLIRCLENQRVKNIRSIINERIRPHITCPKYFHCTYGQQETLIVVYSFDGEQIWFETTKPLSSKTSFMYSERRLWKEIPVSLYEKFPISHANRICHTYPLASDPQKKLQTVEPSHYLAYLLMLTDHDYVKWIVNHMPAWGKHAEDFLFDCSSSYIWSLLDGLSTYHTKTN
jgi:hypothetical protein